MIGTLVENIFGYEAAVKLGSRLNKPIAPPSKALIILTKECNSRCHYCDDWRQGVSGPSLEDVKQSIKSVSELGSQFVTFSGGEPTLRKDLEEIISYANSLGLSTNLCTHGMHLTERRVHQLIDSGLNSIVVSLDTLDPEKYQFLRGVPLSRMWDKFVRLIEISREHKRLLVSINCVISKVSLPSVLDLIKRMSEMGVSTGLQPFHHNPYLSAETNEELAITEDEAPLLRSIIEELVKMKRGGQPISNSEGYLQGIVDFMLYRKGPNRCVAGLVSVNIDNDLDVRPCALLPVVGNLKEANLKEIWNSSKFKISRQRMSILDCPKCWLRCNTEKPRR